MRASRRTGFRALAGNPMPVVASEYLATGAALPERSPAERWDNSKRAPVSTISMAVGQTSAPVWLVSTSATTLGGVGVVEALTPYATNSTDTHWGVAAANNWGAPLPSGSAVTVDTHAQGHRVIANLPATLTGPLGGTVASEDSNAFTMYDP